MVFAKSIFTQLAYSQLHYVDICKGLYVSFIRLPIKTNFNFCVFVVVGYCVTSFRKWFPKFLDNIFVPSSTVKQFILLGLIDSLSPKRRCPTTNTPCNIPADRMSQLHRRGSLKCLKLDLSVAVLFHTAAHETCRHSTRTSPNASSHICVKNSGNFVHKFVPKGATAEWRQSLPQGLISVWSVGTGSDNV